MKLKYLFPLFIAMLTLMVSCDDDESITLLDEVQVSSSYVSIPEGGGSATITVKAKDSWTAEKVTTEKDPVEWLTISSASGSAGETTLTFTAPSAIDGRTAEVLLKSAGKTQRINIIQGLAQISEATVAEVNAGPDGKTYRVTGVCTSIANTQYGNWYLTDATGTLYIYGTLDAKGGKQNFLSLGLEVGDEVTVEGPKTTYGSTVELVDVTVIKINKSLVKVDSVENEVLPIEGGEFTAFLTCKGQGVSVDIPEDAKSWLSISSIESAGTNAVVKFKAAANTGGDRNTTIIFRTTDGSKEYTTETTLTQKGAIVAATVAEFLAAEVGDTQYRLTGVITSIAHDTYGNLYLRDFSGQTYVYGIQDFPTKGLKVGDIITIVGKRGDYKGTPQVTGAVLESVIPVTAATIGEVLAKPDSNTDYFMITGEITSIANDVYGNLYLKDGGSEIYVYGCYPGYGATGDFRKGLIADKGIKVGDELTVIGTKTTYTNSTTGISTIQLANGIYFSHESK
ncbi:MAG: BACON domain-containing carbohydrate-binding protein [Proteiniphilum sp.]|uniref:BACON domain-containing protein n=1 Tax=Proteiniphilum sp. TaxID=1926877 RepID=UPI002B21C7C7|nr:BACON domain-containing carbohydrate-binding protein [Proteiniphilum sp.]MEA5127508.1 BACON domain-containing carbohydrate-binding protein [Proteiniphilum sp.]